MAEARERAKRTHGRGGQWLVAGLALLAAACASAPRVSLNAAVNALPDPLMHLGDDTQHRLASFGRLHETPRLLIIAHGLQADWFARGVVRLPLESCTQALGVAQSEARECTLVALADAETAVVVLSQAPECDRADCLEQSWVFLNDQGAAVPLPARRAADYRSLRADLSREYAEALWLAGYRGRRDARTADAEDPYAEPGDEAGERPSIASYASCMRAPRTAELVCRSREGHLIGLNPLTSVERVIARLELKLGENAEGLSEPPFVTSDGRLAIAVRVQSHALCGGEACTLLGVVEQNAALHFTRVAASR